MGTAIPISDDKPCTADELSMLRWGMTPSVAIAMHGATGELSERGAERMLPFTAILDGRASSARGVLLESTLLVKMRYELCYPFVFPLYFLHGGCVSLA